VQVDYLVQPLEVFREINRVLKTGPLMPLPLLALSLSLSLSLSLFDKRGSATLH
jgi:hypothetical protein